MGLGGWQEAVLLVFRIVRGRWPVVGTHPGEGEGVVLLCARQVLVSLHFQGCPIVPHPEEFMLREIVLGTGGRRHLY